MHDREMQSAIAIIKDEHRSLGAVIRAMQQHLEHAPRQTPDFRLLRAALYYIEAFTTALHHPKEEAYLFRLLRERTDEFDVPLARLERDHVMESQILYELRRALKRYQALTADGPAAFAHTLARFAEAAKEHMEFEEEVILPAAGRHLLPRDWQGIAQAFGKNGDPRFGAVPVEELDQLFAEIRGLMPKGETESGS